MLTFLIIFLILIICGGQKPYSSVNSQSHQESTHNLRLRLIGLGNNTMYFPLMNRIIIIGLVFSILLTLNFTHFGSLEAPFNGLIKMAKGPIFFESFIFLIASFVILLYKNYSSGPLLIILFSLLGMTILISSNDFMTFFLALELQSLPLYILACISASDHGSLSATNASLKYFLLGGLSSSFIIFGCAILYQITGTTNLEILEMINGNLGPMPEASMLAISILICGLLFKISASPFHHWAPDVYDGVSNIITSWLSILPKISIFIFLTKILLAVGGVQISESTAEGWGILILISGILSILIGSLLGLVQYKIRKLLAYSTISHVGFLLLALSQNNPLAISNFIFYLIQYTITSIIIFYILVISESQQFELRDGRWDYINQLKGLAISNPFFAISLTIAFFSLAGIPPLIGFFGKLGILKVTINSGFYLISILAILASVISASYYLKLIKNIYFESTGTPNLRLRTCGIPESYIISINSLLLIGFILKPSYLIILTHELAYNIWL